MLSAGRGGYGQIRPGMRSHRICMRRLGQTKWAHGIFADHVRIELWKWRLAAPFVSDHLDSVHPWCLPCIRDVRLPIS